VKHEWEWQEEWAVYSIRSENPPCEIWIEKRPDYCDRGNFIAKIEASSWLARDMDAEDLWPRYYFDLDRAKAECEAWLEKRAKK
jgi:hypothetical protein